MKNKKNRNKDVVVNTRENRNPEQLPRNEKGEISEEFQESMQEDMRGPMEGMEEVPPKE